MLTVILQNIFAFVLLLLQHGEIQPVEKDIWYYMVYVVSILIVVLVTIYTIKYLINPKEKEEHHIKRIILNNGQENKE